MSDNSFNAYKIPKKVKPKIDYDIDKVLLEDENEFQEFPTEDWPMSSKDNNCWDDSWDQNSGDKPESEFDQKLADECKKALNESNQTKT